MKTNFLLEAVAQGLGAELSAVHFSTEVGLYISLHVPCPELHLQKCYDSHDTTTHRIHFTNLNSAERTSHNFSSSRKSVVIGDRHRR